MFSLIFYWSNCALIVTSSPTWTTFYGDNCYFSQIVDVRATSEIWNSDWVIQFVSIRASWGKASDSGLPRMFHLVLQRKWPSRLGMNTSDIENPNLPEQVLRGFSKQRWWLPLRSDLPKELGWSSSLNSFIRTSKKKNQCKIPPSLCITHNIFGLFLRKNVSSALYFWWAWRADGDL